MKILSATALLLPVLLVIARAGETPVLEPLTPEMEPFDWCDWLQDDPGLLFKDKENPWIQSIEVGGRFQYQAAYVDGSDVKGRGFNGTFDEYRRVRLESEVEFLRFFTAEVDVNLVDDARFRDDPGTKLSWGYDSFNEASLEFDIGEAFGDGWFDGIQLRYGRTKLRMTHEWHESSREILTIERSSLANRLGGGAGRPTGVTLELDKDDWELNLGMFSGEDDADFIGGWNDGRFYYASLEWEPTKEWTFLVDHAGNDQKGIDDFLGYDWATAFSAEYERDRWGILGEAVYGENSGASVEPDPDRRGSFGGVVVMPWYWIVEDKLQVVAQYQYATASRAQGFQVGSRYVRGRHDDPLVDVDNGRGDEFHSLYLGLNYHICGDNLKVMGGVSFDDLQTKGEDVEAVTYLVAFRSSF